MPKELFIGDLKVSEKSKPLIIAEGCDNHLGDIKRAFEMVDLAKEAGADIIKFQHHLPDEEMLPNVPMSDNFKEPLYEFLKKYSLRISDHQKIMERCKKIGIQYLCTPFSYKAAVELKKIKVDGYKIGSGEMTDIPTIEKIAKFNKPILISTGMSNLKEIYETYKAVTKINKKLILMNCTSEYPPEYMDINLNVIPVMKKKFPKALIGHSDHTNDLVTSFGAVALGAVIIEKHFTIDKKNEGPDRDVSIDFSELKLLVKEVKKLYLSLGNKKIVNKREKPIRKWAFRSIVSLKNIKKNQIIKASMVWSKRPGTGIPAKLMKKVIGKKAKKNIKENQLLKWSDLA